MSITLYDEIGPTVFTSSNKNLAATATFLKATIQTGKWVLYRQVNYNDSIAGGSQNDIKILTQADSAQGQVKLNGINGSLYLVPHDTDALVLFKHGFYGGVNPDPTEYISANPDITGTFPAGPAGASSAMVTGNSENWLGYVQKNYGGSHVVFKKGTDIPWFGSIHVNDKIKSVRPE